MAQEQAQPRVLMIGITPPEEGGSQQHIYELSKRIGCDVLTQKGSICENKIELKPKGHILFALAAYWWALWHLLFCLKRKYDVIHIHENTLYFLSIMLSFRYKIIITVHGLEGFKFYENKYLGFLFYIALYFADKLIAVSPSDKKLLRYFNTKYIPNGVDMSLYESNCKYSSLFIQNNITFIGRIHPQKGIDLLLEAFNNINHDIKCPISNATDHYHLIIIGDDKNEYANKLKEKHKDKDIEWKGKINDRQEIANILKQSFCIVLPSRFEGLPLTLFESLASGRPVIVSDIPAFKSVVSDKEVLFFNSENAEDLKRKIYKLLNNNILAEDLGKRGKEFAKKYDWNIISKRTKEIYKS